jgi:hypothetical protein
MKLKNLGFSISKSYKTKLIWATDGWTYDLTKKTRRKFFTDSVIEEPSNLVIPGVHYIEDIEVRVSSPVEWTEISADFEQTYELVQ